jgi:hypothetical protein
MFVSTLNFGPAGLIGWFVPTCSPGPTNGRLTAPDAFKTVDWILDARSSPQSGE